jgi:hypothetical protein
MPASASLYCTRESAQYDGDVYGALDELIAEDQARSVPIIFDFRDRIGSVPYGWKIANDQNYVSEMLKKLKSKGFCALYDGEEFQVKRGTNVFSENYDLTRSDGYSIRLYEVTCRDAAF